MKIIKYSVIYEENYLQMDGFLICIVTVLTNGEAGVGVEILVVKVRTKNIGQNCELLKNMKNIRIIPGDPTFAS